MNETARLPGVAPAPLPAIRGPPRTASVWTAVVIAVAAVAIDQAYLQLSGSLGTNPDLVAAFVTPLAVLGLVPLTAWWERRPLRDYGFTVRGGVGLSLTFATLFALLYLVVELEPGFAFGFGKTVPVSTFGFGYLLFYAPLIAVSECAVFFGLLFRRLTQRMGIVPAMLISAGLSAIATTDFVSLGLLGTDLAVQLLFTTTLTDFVLGLALALYFYKAQWSLLGPVALATAILWIGELFPYAANLPNWEDSFATTLIAGGVVLGAVAVLVREPRLQAKKYLDRPIGPRRLRFRERAENRRSAQGLVVAAVMIAFVVVGADVALPAIAGTPSTPILAIATGSMVPTFHRGTLVLLEKATPGEIHVGTIIAFDVSCLPAPTVHRVYKILQSGSSPVYLTKGDANPSPDPCNVPYSHVIGRAVAWVPDLGFLILDPLFAVALIVLVALVVALVPRPSR